MNDELVYAPARHLFAVLLVVAATAGLLGIAAGVVIGVYL